MKNLFKATKLNARKAARISGLSVRVLARMADTGRLTLIRSGSGRIDAMGRRRDMRVYLIDEIAALRKAQDNPAL